MIVNSDERQWWWMDEGLNSFLQYVAEQEFEKGILHAGASEKSRQLHEDATYRSGTCYD
jgi:hypothetical protein